MCKNYPAKKLRSNGALHEGCGYRIVPEKSFDDFRIKEKDFPGMKTEKGISVLEFFFVNDDCMRQ
jgi:hypothetical protein